MFGDNPKRRPVKGDGSVLEVQEIFRTIQGEGPNTGVPAIFIRLGGCNLACKFCDTEFESFRKMQIEAVLGQVSKLKESVKLVVITGGEPLRQPIEKLCRELLDKGFRVQIETNGTLYRKLPAEVEIVCSPKNTGKGYTPIREDLLARLNAIKFIVSANDNLYKDIAEVGQKKSNIPVYIQPMDEVNKRKNRENHRHAAALTAKHGAILSLQIHKMLGMP